MVKAVSYTIVQQSQKYMVISSFLIKNEADLIFVRQAEFCVWGVVFWLGRGGGFEPIISYLFISQA